MLIPMAAAGLKSNAAATTGLVLPTTAYVDTPDAAVFDITGAIGLIAKVKLADWTPTSAQTIVSKWGATRDPDQSYIFQVLSTGELRFGFATGGTLYLAPSTVATGITDGNAQWIAVSRSGSTVKAWLGGDGDTPTWSQLGTDVSISVSTGNSGSASATISRHSYPAGQVTTVTAYHTRIYDGVGAHTAPDQGTLIADPDFTTEWTDTGGTQHTDSQGNVWTIGGTGYSWE